MNDTKQFVEPATYEKPRLERLGIWSARTGNCGSGKGTGGPDAPPNDNAACND